MHKSNAGSSLGRVSAVLAVLTVLAPGVAHATHFRYGTIDWHPAGGNKITFHLQNAWRRNGYNTCYHTNNTTVPCTGTGGLPGVGDIIREDIGTTRFDFGDGNSVGSNANNPLYYQVTSIDVTNNWLFGEALDGNKLPAADPNIDHTYATTGNFTAGIDSCCRISAVLAPNEHINNPDVPYRVQTTVSVGSVRCV